jgi:hypothetical protein
MARRIRDQALAGGATNCWFFFRLTLETAVPVVALAMALGEAAMAQGGLAEPRAKSAFVLDSAGNVRRP